MLLAPGCVFFGVMAYISVLMCLFLLYPFQGFAYFNQSYNIFYNTFGGYFFGAVLGLLEIFNTFPDDFA